MTQSDFEAAADQITITRSNSIAKLAMALSKAQAAITSAQKDASNPLLKYNYATLASMWEACRKPLTDNGLAIIQLPTAVGAMVTVQSMLVHGESGEMVTCSLMLQAESPAKGGAVVSSSPQAIGSAITYARKYLLASMVGIAPDDDDGSGGPPVTGREDNEPTGETATERARREYQDRARAATNTPAPAAAPKAEAPPPAPVAPKPAPSGKTHPGKDIPEAHRVAHWTQVFTEVSTGAEYDSLRAEFVESEPTGGPVRKALQDLIGKVRERVRGPAPAAATTTEPVKS